MRLQSLIIQNVIMTEAKQFSDMFDEIVQAVPDQTAVVYKDRKYTYKEIDKLSDRLGNIFYPLELTGKRLYQF